MSDRPNLGSRLDLGEILVSTASVEREQIERARAQQNDSGGRLLDILVEHGVIKEQEALSALAQQLGLGMRTSLAPDEVDEAIVQQLPIGFAKRHQLLPIETCPDGRIRVVAADPLETAPLDDLRLFFDGAEILVELATPETILNTINLVYDRGHGSTDQLAEAAEDDLDALAYELGSEPQDLLEATDDAPIIRLVNSMLQHAVKERASDIHIEPFEKEIRVRFRIDDVL